MEKVFYPNMMAPLKVGNTVFRNRMFASASTPNNIQGPENYPSENLIQMLAHKAKAGAAMVTASGFGNNPFPNDHSLIFDFTNGGVQHQLTRLTESIHYYGAAASIFLFPQWDQNYDVGDKVDSFEPYPSVGRPQYSIKQIEKMIEDYADQAALARDVGFDMAYIHAAYRALPVGRFLSPITNNRKDEFGGSVENRARFLMMLCDRIKQKCGRDFLLEVSISAQDNVPGGTTIEDTIEVAKLGEGHFDLIQPRAHGLDPAHPSCYYKEHTPYLYINERMKKAGVTMPVVGIAGFLYPEECEDALASGKVDFVSMARAWVTNPDYGDIIHEGRRDDLVPCIRCGKCYFRGSKPIWKDTCSVNPMWTWDGRQQYFIAPVGQRKNVAVVGGGPAGMQAAIVAAKRGHKVTLFEKEEQLGGQLNAAEIPSFKWPVRDFKKYLIHQVEKSGVEVRLGTKATAETLDAGDYDAVLAAVGAEPNIPRLPGVDGANVVPAINVYGSENELKETVVIVGGGEIGTETGMHLAELGHKVKLIEMTDKLAPDAPPYHFRSMLIEYADNTENFEYILNAKCKEITPNGVVYLDKDGLEHELLAGSVVLATGSRGCQEDALALFSRGRKVTLIGDCSKAADIHSAMRTGFAAASQL